MDFGQTHTTLSRNKLEICNRLDRFRLFCFL